MKTHYIDGRWIAGAGDSFSSTNPCNNSIVWNGRNATEAEIVSAYEAARCALPAWTRLGYNARANHLHAFAQQITAQSDALTSLISLETGKPHWEAKTETQSVIAKIDMTLQAFQERMSEKKVIDASNITQALRYKPHGVMAVLGPFNFPAHLSNGHIVPALLAGNSIVYKPSELTPGVAAFIMQCWHDSGLPSGVLNLIQGHAPVAKHLLNQPIQAIAFTGSYRAGLDIHQQMSQRPDVLLALEMGGNNPLVLEHVEHLSPAIYHTVLSSFLTAGQRCSSARRLILPKNPMGDRFLDQLIQTSKKIKIGSPDDSPEPFFGPVIRHAHALQHIEAQRRLINLGAQSLLAMNLLKENTGFLSPGIIDMTPVSTPPDHEIFAPLIQVYRYDDFDEAIELANQTQYGLAAGLFSDNPATYEQFFHAVRAGLIYWNRPTTGASSQLPFGGIGRSGNHRPSAYFATDYCAYPIASLEQAQPTLPDHLLPGLSLE